MGDRCDRKVYNMPLPLNEQNHSFSFFFILPEKEHRERAVAHNGGSCTSPRASSPMRLTSAKFVKTSSASSQHAARVTFG